MVTDLRAQLRRADCEMDVEEKLFNEMNEKLRDFMAKNNHMDKVVREYESDSAV